MLYIRTIAKYKSPSEKERIRRAKETERNNNSDEFTFPILEKSEDFYRDINKRAFFCVSHVMNECVRMLAIAESMDVFNKYFLKFAKQLDLGVDLENAVHEELTYGKFTRMLSNASRNGYIISDDEILTDFDADHLNCPWSRNVNFDEEILAPVSKEETYTGAEKYLTVRGLKEEFGRIYDEASMKKKHISGNPCHYIIESSDALTAEESSRLLLSALCNAGRISCRRYSVVSFSQGADWSDDAFGYILRSAENGAVILNLKFKATEDGEYAGAYKEIVSKICSSVQKYRNKALVIFCISKDSDAVKTEIYEKLRSISFVEIEDETAFGELAGDYLKMLAKESRVKPNKALLSKIEDGQGYTEPELKTIFDEWMDAKMKASYPQYKLTKSARTKLKEEKPQGSAYDELMAMEGLDEAKAVIKKALDFYKAQKLFKDRGLKVESANLSCAFLGNPGSGKTETAKIFGRILKENNILATGQTIYCSRADLVGKYVGHTAAQVKEMFNKAVGGVLVIDECYSLNIESGGFGEEAIAQIVLEADVHKSDVMVIYSGYKDEMEAFIDRNPGLKSRIQFYVPFPDYSVEALVKISGYIADKKGYAFSESAKEMLASIFEITSKIKNSGNARNARNVVEQAIFRHSSRLVNGDVEKWTKEDLLTLTEEDLELPEENKKEERKVIGFCA